MTEMLQIKIIVFHRPSVAVIELIGSALSEPYSEMKVAPEAGFSHQHLQTRFLSLAHPKPHLYIPQFQFKFSFTLFLSCTPADIQRSY